MPVLTNSLILIRLKQTWNCHSEVVASHLLPFSLFRPRTGAASKSQPSPLGCSCRVSPCVLTLRFNSMQQSLAEMKGRQVWKALWSVTLKPNGSLGFHANFGLISAISNCKRKKRRLMQMGRIWYFCEDLNVCLLARHLRRICACCIWNCLGDMVINMQILLTGWQILTVFGAFWGEMFPPPKLECEKVGWIRKYANYNRLCVFSCTC